MIDFHQPVFIKPDMSKEKTHDQSFEDHYKAFARIMDTLGRKYDHGRIFSDFLTMAICAHHTFNIQAVAEGKNLNHHKDPDNEKLYMDTIAKYDKQEVRNDFPKLLGHFRGAVYAKPYSDLLGLYYTEAITKGQNGQYFTPDSLTDLMTQLIQPGENTIEFKTVADPACGSGRMLLSFAKNNPRNFFFGNDVSATCTKMTAVNFFFNGLKGQVAQMDTLSLQFYQAWEINTESLGIKPIEKEQCILWTNPEAFKKPPFPPPSIDESTNQDMQNKAGDPGTQLILF